MTPLDFVEDMLINMSRQQRLLLEDPYEQRRRTLVARGLPEEKVNQLLDWEAKQVGPIIVDYAVRGSSS